jgi:hypothetical protein
MVSLFWYTRQLTVNRWTVHKVGEWHPYIRRRDAEAIDAGDLIPGDGLPKEDIRINRRSLRRPEPEEPSSCRILDADINQNMYEGTEDSASDFVLRTEYGVLRRALFGIGLHIWHASPFQLHMHAEVPENMCI